MRLIWLFVLTAIVATIAKGNALLEFVLFIVWLFCVWFIYPAMWSSSTKWRTTPIGFFVDRAFGVVIAAIIFWYLVGDIGKNDASKLDKSLPAKKEVTQASSLVNAEIAKLNNQSNNFTSAISSVSSVAMMPPQN